MSRNFLERNFVFDSITNITSHPFSHKRKEIVRTVNVKPHIHVRVHIIHVHSLQLVLQGASSGSLFRVVVSDRVE